MCARRYWLGSRWAHHSDAVADRRLRSIVKIRSCERCVCVCSLSLTDWAGNMARLVSLGNYTSEWASLYNTYPRRYCNSLWKKMIFDFCESLATIYFLSFFFLNTLEYFFLLSFLTFDSFILFTSHFAALSVDPRELREKFQFQLRTWISLIK